MNQTEDIKLGTSISLSGFRDLDGGKMVVLKKVTIGRISLLDVPGAVDMLEFIDTESPVQGDQQQDDREQEYDKS